MGHPASSISNVSLCWLSKFHAPGRRTSSEVLEDSDNAMLGDYLEGLGAEFSVLSPDKHEHFQPWVVMLRTQLYTVHPLNAIKVCACWWHHTSPDRREADTHWLRSFMSLTLQREYGTTTVNVENSLKCHIILRTVPCGGGGSSVLVHSPQRWKTYHVSCFMRRPAEFIKQDASASAMDSIQQPTSDEASWH